MLYDFTAASSLDISKLACGESLDVLEQPATGWWLGRTPSGEMGLFPSNYVRLGGAAQPPSPLAATSAPGAATAAAPLGDPVAMRMINSVESFDALMNDGVVVEPDASGSAGTAPVQRGQVSSPGSLPRTPPQWKPSPHLTCFQPFLSAGRGVPLRCHGVERGGGPQSHILLDARCGQLPGAVRGRRESRDQRSPGGPRVAPSRPAGTYHVR